MTELPPVQESGPLCPNCGKALAEGGRYCPHCGWTPEPSRSGEKVLYGLLTLLVGLPALLIGGCFCVVGGGGLMTPGGASADRSFGLAFGAIGLVGVAIFALLLWLFIRSFRR